MAKDKAKKMPTQAEVRQALHRWYKALLYREIHPRNSGGYMEYVRAHCALKDIVRRQREPAVIRSMRRLARSEGEKYEG